jgi:lysophospholipase L1-like esterase
MPKPSPDIEHKSLRESQPMRRWWFWHVRRRVYRRLGRFARRVHGRGPLLVVLGDSLTDPGSGFTLPRHVWLRRIARQGYKTVNLAVSGDTTADMRQRIEQTLSEGQPEFVVLFGGANDTFYGVDLAQTERNITLIVDWLRGHGICNIGLMSPGLLNWNGDAASASGIEDVREVFGRVAERRGAIFVDLVGFLGARIERGEDPDFSRAPYRQSRSWHVLSDDPHFNAYGQRLIAEAFLAATADWPRAP